MLLSVPQTQPSPRTFRDFRFFWSWETIFVAIGTIALACLEMDLVPKNAAFYWWVSDFKFWIVIALGILIVVPPVLAKGLLHLRNRDAAAKFNIEFATALTAMSSRTANLIHKMKELSAGNVTHAYVNHTLTECQSYFQARRTIGGRPVEHDSVRVDVGYFELKIGPGAHKLERVGTTAAESKDFTHVLSTKGTSIARSWVDSIEAGQRLWLDLNDPTLSETLKCNSTSVTTYRVAMALPVFAERKDTEVIGMLMVLSSSELALEESDVHLIRAFAWHIAAASYAEKTIS